MDVRSVALDVVHAGGAAGTAGRVGAAGHARIQVEEHRERISAPEAESEADGDVALRVDAVEDEADDGEHRRCRPGLDGRVGETPDQARMKCDVSGDVKTCAALGSHTSWCRRRRT